MSHRMTCTTDYIATARAAIQRSSSAAACVAEWLGGLATEKQNAKRLSFILALKAGYEARI